MIEPNDIWHLCAPPLTCKTTGYKRTTSLRSTPIRHFFDMHVSRVSFGQQIPSTVSRASLSYQFVQATPHEATAVDTSSPLPVAAVAAIPEVGSCGFNWEDIS